MVKFLNYILYEPNQPILHNIYHDISFITSLNCQYAGIGLVYVEVFLLQEIIIGNRYSESLLNWKLIISDDFEKMTGKYGGDNQNFPSMNIIA